MNIILLAPPAAGKGTQAKKIISKYNLKHISTGDLLRNALKKNDEMAMKIESIMNSGKLVNDDIILKLIENELENSENGVVLDGFPRNLNQALECEQLFKKLNQKIDYVLYFEIDKEIAKKRVVGRRTCSNCGRIYNTLIESEMPKIKEICNDCNILLTHRSDDNEETFDLRYETYMKETNPLIAFYEDKGILKRIDSSLNTEEVFKTIEKVLDGDL
jgi:adenylate kinase